jgi:probable F420-dependent oxidoreductase
MTIDQPAGTPPAMKVGVIIQVGEWQGHAAPGYAQIRAFALQAESAGFDAIWVYDHLLFRFESDPVKTQGVWECWTMMAALAEATTRVELGALVLCVPFRNPAVLAKMAATLDEVSGGRLILGLGAGWHQPEFDAFGVPFDHKVDRFEEALKIIVLLLREGQVDFQGSHYSARDCVISPRGPRTNGPPILIGSFGPRMLRLTADYADMWNTCWLGQPDGLAERRAKLEAACADAGRDPSTLPVTVGVSVAYTTSGEEAPPPEKALSGSPAEVAAGLRAYADLGVAHVICSLNKATPEALAWLSEALSIYRGQ